MTYKDFRPFGDFDYPPMKLPKQENATSSFEEKSRNLDDFISRSYDFFMDYGGRKNKRRNELRSTIFLEDIFLQILDEIRETYQMRGHLLLDENLAMFENRLKVLNEKMRTSQLFIRTSNNTLESELKADNTCFAEARRDTVENFHKHDEWLRTISEDPKKRVRIRALANHLQLNYSVKLFGCMGDDFEQHANMVFNGLMMLAMPSMADLREEEFAQIFQNSIDTFRKGSLWQAMEAQLEEDINHDLMSANCDSYKAKMARLKDLWWKPRRTAIQNMLRKAGITYVNALSQNHLGRIGRQLYERLNGIRIDKKDESPLQRITNDDLCMYFKLESELQLLAGKIEKYRLLENDPLPPDDYFNSDQPRKKIMQAIYNTIHEKGDNSREVLYAQSHWFAIHKVFENHQMCCGTLKDFYNVMNKWFPTPPHPCDYDSLKNMKVPDIRQKCYTEWSAAISANVPYRRVALTLAKYLRKEGLID